MTARRAIGLLLLAVAGAAVLHSARATLPTPPVTEPRLLDEWWVGQSIAGATLAVVRLVGLAFCSYLALISSLGAVAALTRWQWTMTLTNWVATPALRRMVAGGSLAVALSSASTAAAAGPALFAVADIGAAKADDHSIEATGPTGADNVYVLPNPSRAPYDGYPARDLGSTRPDGFAVNDIGKAELGRLPVSDPGETRPDRFTVSEPGETRPDRFTVSEPGETRPDGYTVSDPGEARPDRFTVSEPGETRPDRFTVSEPGETRPDRFAVSDPGEARPDRFTVRDIGNAEHDGLAVRDLGSAASGGSTVSSPEAVAGDSVDTADDVATPAVIPRAGRTASHLGGASAADVSDDTDAEPEAWLVEAGDHLWGIAAETVTERTGTDDHMAVLRYWLRLIEANAEVLGEDPDLIHPGQVFRLPR